MTVFFSSHQIAEVDQVADGFAIVERGQAVVAGSLDAVRERYCRIQLVFEGEAPDAAFRTPGAERVRRSGRVLTIISSAGSAALIEEARPLRPASVDVTPITLKEIFLETVVREERNE
jgi:ABC-2 type transport system ATP-binding protein